MRQKKMQIQYDRRWRGRLFPDLEAATTDYKNLDLEASDIQKKIADPDNLTLLKDVITKLD